MYLLDTDTVAELMKRNPVTWQTLLDKRRREVFLCEVVIGEILYGIRLLGDTKKGRQLQAEFDPILETVGCLKWDRGTTAYFADVRSTLTSSGQTIADIDIMIAAHALNYECAVVTDNTKDFARIPGLAQVNWKY